MNLTIEMYDPQGTILHELTDKRITQPSIAITYAFCIAQLGDAADWPRINAAIRERWPSKSGLTRVKEMAWKHVEGFKKAK